MWGSHAKPTQSIYALDYILSKTQHGCVRLASYSSTWNLPFLFFPSAFLVFFCWDLSARVLCRASAWGHGDCPYSSWRAGSKWCQTEAGQWTVWQLWCSRHRCSAEAAWAAALLGLWFNQGSLSSSTLRAVICPRQLELYMYSRCRDTLYKDNFAVRTKKLRTSHCVLTAMVLLSKDNSM